MQPCGRVSINLFWGLVKKTPVTQWRGFFIGIYLDFLALDIESEV
jgi:hypothetical protein